jgi:hypothetical protein
MQFKSAVKRIDWCLLASILLMLACWAIEAHGQTFTQSKERKLEIVTYAVAIASDSWASTRSNSPELDPFARPFVNHGNARQALGGALGFAVGVVPSYLLHRSGHLATSHWWLRTFTAGESVNASRILYE